MLNEPPPQQQPDKSKNLPIDLTVINQSAQMESVSADKASNNLAAREKQYLINDGKRGESYKSHIHNIVVIGMYAIGLVMILLIFIYAFHIAAPCRWRWLTNDELHVIERIIFSGIIVSLASKYFKRYKVISD